MSNTRYGRYLELSFAKVVIDDIASRKSAYL